MLDEFVPIKKMVRAEAVRWYGHVLREEKTS